MANKYGFYMPGLSIATCSYRHMKPAGFQIGAERVEFVFELAN